LYESVEPPVLPWLFSYDYSHSIARVARDSISSVFVGVILGAISANAIVAIIDGIISGEGLSMIVALMVAFAMWSVFRHTFTEKSLSWWIAYLIAFLAGFIVFVASGKSRQILVHLVSLFGS